MAEARRGGRGGVAGSGPLSKGTVPLRLVQEQDLTMAKEDILPARPSLIGERNGNAVKLCANCFDLTVDKPVEVSKYNFTILGGREQKEEIKNASARQIFKSALTSLQISSHEYATDYTRQIATLSPFKVPEDEGRLNVAVDGCVVKFDDPVQVRLDTSVSVTPSQDVIDCLNLITGQWCREQTTTMATIGRHRLFPKSENLFSGNDKLGDLFETSVPEMLSVARGFFTGVRPAVDKLLFNVNVTFGVFRPHGEIQDLYNRLKESQQLAEHPGRKVEVLSKLHQAISRARVYYSAPGAAKVTADGSAPKTVPIAGFARKTDSSKDKEPSSEL